MNKIIRECAHHMSSDCMGEYAMVSTELTEDQKFELYQGSKKVQDILPPAVFSASFREGAKNHMPMCPACQAMLFGGVKLNNHEHYEDVE